MGQKDFINFLLVMLGRIIACVVALLGAWMLNKLFWDIYHDEDRLFNFGMWVSKHLFLGIALVVLLGSIFGVLWVIGAARAGKLDLVKRKQ